MSETLVPSSSIAPESTFEEDLNKLAQLLEDNEPAYILARLDSDGVEWLAISYVPDTAKVRDKVCHNHQLHYYCKLRHELDWNNI